MAGNVLVTGGAKRIGHAIINAGGDRASVLQGDLANMAAMVRCGAWRCQSQKS